MKEVWKPIFDEEFAVSNIGRVKRIKPSQLNPAGYILKPHLERPKRNKHHYVKVTLWHNKKVYTRWVHRLVCEAFLGPRPSGCWVNHIDGNKSNNKLNNLEYVSYSENIRHAYRNGLHPNCLSIFAIKRIKKLYKLGIKPKEIGLIYGINPDYASLIAREKIVHLSYLPVK